MAAMYQLVARTGPNTGSKYPLEKPEVFIGRDLNNDIVINDPEMSRRHARMYIQGSTYLVEDLGSTNGTSVSGQRLMNPYVLQPGEQITFGEHVSMIFESLQPDQAATIASARGPVSSSRPTAQAPVYTPAGQPVPSNPPPVRPAYTPPPAQPVYAPPAQPIYSGQMPLQPDEEVAPANKFPIWLIVLIILLLLMCLCLVIFVAIDQLNLWCTLFGWFFRLLGPGYCP